MSDRLEQLLKLYKTDPSDPFCTYGIALEHAKAGRPQEAIEWLDKTLVLDGHYHYAFYQKAKMLIDLGQTEQAREVLKSGIVAAANDDKAHSELTELLEMI